MLTFSKKSWHYKAAKFHNIWLDDESEDLCRYTRWVLAGVLKISLITIAITLILGSMADSLAWLVSMVISLNIVEPNPWAIPGLSLLGLILTVLVVEFVGKVLIGKVRIFWPLKRREFTENKPNSFLKAQYIRFKSKVCFNIDFID